MKFSLLCSFVCFSTLFVGTVFAGTGFSEKVVSLTNEFLNCRFTQLESKSFFAQHPEEIKDKEENVVDIFDLPGYLRWPSLGGVTEEEEGKRTGLTIQAVVNDIYTLDGIPEGTPIIIFASHGLKGVAAMRFAIQQKTDKPNSKIVIFVPSKRIRISVSEAYNTDFKSDLNNCKGNGLEVLENEQDLTDFLSKNPEFKDGFIIEGLFGIGFKSQYGLNPEAVPIVDMFLTLNKAGWKVISIDVPALYNVDAGLDTVDKTTQKTTKIPLQTDVEAKDYSYSQRKDHELCVPKLKGPAVQIKDQIYKPFAVIFIGFLKPCYDGLKQAGVKYIYVGGHLFDAHSVEKFLQTETIKKRCPDLKAMLFPTYQPDTLFHRIPTS